MSAICVQHASLTYRRYQRPQDALWEWLLRRPCHQMFHALRDVSFKLESGNSLGLVGDNGAGKSTLLRMLAGNLSPTQGSCVVNGSRSALLELGSGLQPSFSGIENARIGLALRGLGAENLEQWVKQVLAFAELGEFANRPVSTYSSGMVVRLVFAIAAVAKPEILIVDEALSVGDQYFQKKSLDRMRAILANGATLIFCSHNLYQVREICEQALWLEQGQVRMLGDAQTVVDAYQDAVRARTGSNDFSNKLSMGEVTGETPQRSSETQITAEPTLSDIVLSGAQGVLGGLPRFMTDQRFIVHISLDTACRSVADIHVGIVIRRNDDVQCYGISTLHDGINLVSDSQGGAQLNYVIDSLPLLAGEYCLEVWLIDNSGVHVYDARERCCYFRVQQASQTQGVGMNWIPHRWEIGREVSHAVEQA